MKNIFASLIVFMSVHAAQASMPHPCTPRIQARPILMYCQVDNIYYNIRVNIRTSDPARCTGQYYVERKTAVVEVSNRQGRVLDQAELAEGQFAYTLRGPEGATFRSENPSLDLKNCSVPPNGGFSVGN